MEILVFCKNYDFKYIFIFSKINTVQQKQLYALAQFGLENRKKIIIWLQVQVFNCFVFSTI